VEIVHNVSCYGLVERERFWQLLMDNKKRVLQYFSKLFIKFFKYLSTKQFSKSSSNVLRTNLCVLGPVYKPTYHHIWHQRRKSKTKRQAEKRMEGTFQPCQQGKSLDQVPKTTCHAEIKTSCIVSTDKH